MSTGRFPQVFHPEGCCVVGQLQALDAVGGNESIPGALFPVCRDGRRECVVAGDLVFRIGVGWLVEQEARRNVGAFDPAIGKDTVGVKSALSGIHKDWIAAWDDGPGPILLPRQQRVGGQGHDPVEATGSSLAAK